jgi:hypothetical protein
MTESGHTAEFSSGKVIENQRLECEVMTGSGQSLKGSNEYSETEPRSGTE